MEHRSKRRHLPSSERRRLLLDAAGRVFERGGYGAMTMVAVAAEAGVSRQLVYDHFQDLPTLQEEFFDDALTRYVAIIDQAVASGEDDPARGFAAAFEQVLAMPVQARRAVTLLISDRSTPGLEHLRERFRAHVDRRWLPAIDAPTTTSTTTSTSVARAALWAGAAGFFQLVELVHAGEVSTDEATAVASAMAARLPEIAAEAAT